MLVGEEDKYTRIFLQELLQPTKKAQVIVTDLLHRTTDNSRVFCMVWGSMINNAVPLEYC